MSNIETEPMNVMITFLGGQRAQYQILVPEVDDISLQVWFNRRFNTHKFVSARETTNTANMGEVCVDDCVTFINLESVRTIKELDW
jgi:hypothetical protein